MSRHMLIFGYGYSAATFAGRLLGEGWISVPEFWDIYYNNPQKLPGEIDFAKLDQLKNLPDPELSEGKGDQPQQPDTIDQTPDSALDPTLDPTLDPSLNPSAAFL